MSCFLAAYALSGLTLFAIVPLSYDYGRVVVVNLTCSAWALISTLPTTFVFHEGSSSTRHPYVVMVFLFYAFIWIVRLPPRSHTSHDHNKYSRCHHSSGAQIYGPRGDIVSRAAHAGRIVPPPCCFRILFSITNGITRMVPECHTLCYGVPTAYPNRKSIANLPKLSDWPPRRSLTNRQCRRMIK